MSQDAAGDHVPSEPAMPSGQQSQISHGEHHAG